MESVKLFIPNFEEQYRAAIEVYLVKCNSVFRHKGFTIELCNEKKDAVISELKEVEYKKIAGSMIYTSRENRVLVCQYENIDTLALHIIIGFGAILDYNLPDVTDIKDGKLSIDLEDLVNFANIKTFSEHPCIKELNERLAQFPETEDQTLLKQKSDMVSNLRRYQFMVFNWLNFRFNFDNKAIDTTTKAENPEYISKALNGYEKLFDTSNPIAQRVNESIEQFKDAVELSGREENKGL